MNLTHLLPFLNNQFLLSEIIKKYYTQFGPILVSGVIIISLYFLIIGLMASQKVLAHTSLERNKLEAYKTEYGLNKEKTTEKQSPQDEKPKEAFSIMGAEKFVFISLIAAFLSLIPFIGNMAGHVHWLIIRRSFLYFCRNYGNILYCPISRFLNIPTHYPRQ